MGVVRNIGQGIINRGLARYRYVSGYYRRQIAQIAASGALVLAYHDIVGSGVIFPGMEVSVRHFRAQLELLARYYRFVSLDGLMERLQKGKECRGLAVITFDDGFSGVYEHALPVLRGFGIPATVFLTTHPVSTGTRCWQVNLLLAVQESALSCLSVPGMPDVRLRPFWRRPAAYGALYRYLGRLDSEAMQAGLQEILERLGNVRGRHLRMLTPGQVTELSGTEVTFENHTHTHPFITQTGPDRLSDELGTARDLIAGWTGRQPRWFAYPNGCPEDVTREVIDAVCRSGMEGGFTLRRQTVLPEQDKFTLGRIPVKDHSRPELCRFLGTNLGYES